MNFKFIPFGYRCSSAGLLKELNVKKESYPFDWLISRLPIIKHIITNNFIEFLNKNNYLKINTKTIHYTNDNNENKIICEEKILYNNYYEKLFNNNILIPKNLSNSYDTYKYFLAMNHKNVIDNYDYYLRCIDRFNYLMKEDISNKLYLHITPIISIEEYIEKKDTILIEFNNFHNFILDYNKFGIIKGLFIIVIKDNNIENSYLENIYCSESNNIYLFRVKKDFIDAGEIYYQPHNFLETRILLDLIKNNYMN
jgi:hypothetical protein